MNLVIDQGNTRTKLAVFNESQMIKDTALDSMDLEQIESWIEAEASECQNVIVSNVTQNQLNLEGKIAIHLSSDTDLPIFNNYDSPETLGNDRLANAVAIWAKNPAKNSLCIDIGTCIKYDLVNAEGAYLGGNISPGMKMRYNSLNSDTGKLPLISPTDEKPSYGKNTETSIQSGVQQGIYHEIMGFIERYSEEMEGLTIFMTGGDLKYFDIEYKNPIFADSSLTLFGLNEILNHNT